MQRSTTVLQRSNTVLQHAHGVLKGDVSAHDPMRRWRCGALISRATISDPSAFSTSTTETLTSTL